jgi:formylglycine-generating enzyme required for sulfatase activity
MSSQRSIFISYRRSDSKDFTRSLYDHLAKYFGHRTVFRDLDSIPAGCTFKEYIESELANCHILIAVIGPTWLDIRDRDGCRRIDDPKDWVRLEIEYALERQIPVIPLLLNETKLPSEYSLPGKLKVLPTIHFARVRYEPEHSCQLKKRDLERLISDIKRLQNEDLPTVKVRQLSSDIIQQNLGSGPPLELVKIPGGTFLMGSPENEDGRDPSEGPLHQVTVPSFWMGKYPVTQAQWEAVARLPRVRKRLNSNPSQFQGSNLPVEKIGWRDAEEFCARLFRHAGKAYRLPTEAEWEYACRAETSTPYYFGKTLSTDYCNFNNYYGKTTEVGSFLPNAFHLYDMHGNVWEWCNDSWHKDYRSAPIDGSAWIDGWNVFRVFRGGCWFSNHKGCRSAYRNFGQHNSIGFRVACSALNP